jgi:uncharacterized protein
LQLAAYEGHPEWRILVERMLSTLQEAMARYPTVFAQWLQAADFLLGPSYEVAIIGNTDLPRTQELLKAVRKNYQPRQVVAISAFPPGPGSPALLMDRPMLNDLATAYICQGFVCLKPTNSSDEMMAQLTGQISF